MRRALLVASLLLVPGLVLPTPDAEAAITFRATTVSTGTPTTSLSLVPPAGTLANDVLVAQVAIRNGGTVTAPASWTLLDARATGTGVGNVGQHVYVKIATASETTAYQWTGSQELAGAIVAYSGVDTASPVVALASQANAASTLVAAPALSGATTGDLLVGFFASDDGRSSPFTTPAGMSKRLDFAGQVNDFGFAWADAVRASDGNVASFSATSSRSDVNIGTSLLLRPPSVRFAAGSTSVYEGAGTIPITIQTSSASSRDVTVSYTLSVESTASSADHTLGAGTLTVPAGATSATLQVPLVDDAIIEGDETLVIDLSAPIDARLASPTRHVLTILEDDPLISVTLVDTAGGAAGTVWGGWSVDPGATLATTTNYLRIASTSPNTAARPTVTINFADDAFAGTDASQTIPIDGNIQFACAEDATGTKTPADMLGSFVFGANSATASTMATFTAGSDTGATLYCAYRLASIPQMLLDQSYQASYTVSAT